MKLFSPPYFAIRLQNKQVYAFHDFQPCMRGSLQNLARKSDETLSHTSISLFGVHLYRTGENGLEDIFFPPLTFSNRRIIIFGLQ